MRKHATHVLAILATDNSANKVSIARAGAIPPLVQLLGSGSSSSEPARLYAAHTLRNLAADNGTNSVSIAGAGAIPLLVQLLGSSSNEAVREAAVCALGTLANNTEANRISILDSIARARTIPALVYLLGSSNSKAAREHAATALNYLAAQNDANRVSIAAAGGESAEHQRPHHSAHL